MRKLTIGLGLVLGAAMVWGCDDMKWGGEKKSEPKPAMAKTEKSLYERLGGQPAIDAVCDDFVNRAASNPKVDFFRKNTPGAKPWEPSSDELATFKTHLKQWVSRAAGAPVTYEGQDMKTVHKGMKITNAQFDAIAADLSASLDKFKVPAKEKAELMAAVAATRKDLVEPM